MESKHGNILVIEDEVKLARFVELELKYEGYTVDIEHNGREGFEKYLNNEYDLILLDLMLPGLNGLEICRRIRKEASIPIIMLTAKDEVMDKVIGLDSGANDYITKPFAIEELLARMRVALRKNDPGESKKTLEYKNLVVDFEKHQITINDNVIELTKKEFDLLTYLLQNKNIVITRDQILNEVWGYEYIGETNVVDVYVRYLRQKIDEVYNDKYIHTVRGVGYVIRD